MEKVRQANSVYKRKRGGRDTGKGGWGEGVELTSKSEID